MLHNYLKIAIRNLLRNKTFSAINISGLAIGMASALLILLWVHNELTFDRWYPNTSRLYQVYNRDNIQGNLLAWPNTPKVMAPFLKKDYASVDDVTRFRNIHVLVTVGDTRLTTAVGACVDSGFLDMFGFPLLQGDPAHALSTPKGIVLTRKFATTLFGSADPIGKTVRIDSSNGFTVTAVLRDLPANTSFSFDYLLPWSYMMQTSNDNDQWGSNSVYTFVLLKPGAGQAAFDARVRNITIDHSGHRVTTQVFTQPMSRLYLYDKTENGALVGGKIHIVQLFALIAGFILLIACINFMNLSTARSEKRSREVGIRKVAGAVRGYLIAQFIGESIFIAAISFALALLLAHLALDGFNQLVGKQLVIEYGNPLWWAFALGFIFFTGLLAGSYPAFYLSGFQPVKVLKGAFKKTGALVSTRKVLVVLQFAVAIALIISTLVVRRQIRHAQDRDTGYIRSNLIYTFNSRDITKNYEAIKHDLLAGGAVLSMSQSYSPITAHWADGWGYSWQRSTPSDKYIDFIHLSTDATFTKTMGATLVAGRDIDVYKYPTDSNAVMLNETAVRTMRVKDPIGMIIRRDNEAHHVVGVIKDFILESPYLDIAPMMIEGPAASFDVIHLKLNPAWPVAANMAQVQKVFKEYNPQFTTSFIFVDEAYAGKFKDERQIGTLAALFAGLTILISCLGLFALATYMAENRIREIGVRKVLGATVTGITTMLAKDFVWLVLIAFVVAAPLAWLLMHQWLINYTYRVPIGWDIFALAGGLALFIAVATVSYQAIRAAIANPVKALRSE